MNIDDIKNLSLEERIKLAQNSENIEILKILIKDENRYVRESVTYNSNTSSETLKILANDEDMDVRMGVASNPNTLIEILEILANDKHYFVRERVANNPNTPIEVLQILVNDDVEYVRCGVACNPNTPSETLEILAKDENRNVRHEVAFNPNTSIETLEILANDECWYNDEYEYDNIAKERLSLFKKINDKSINFKDTINDITNEDLKDTKVIDALVNRVKTYDCSKLIDFNNVNKNPNDFLGLLKGIDFDTKTLIKDLDNEKKQFGED